MGNPNALSFNVDINVINHLGTGLYSSTPAALTELVANAWDAEANEVSITIIPAERKIIIEDDGHGMDLEGIRNKFLNVGYSRRGPSGSVTHTSQNGKRHVMGRKGIGKLSMFALADSVKVSSQIQGGSPISFVIDVPALRQAITHPSGNKFLLDEEDSPVPLKKGKGTRIELSKVLTGLNTTESYLRVKLARRFSVIGDAHDFSVKLNGKPIVLTDRGFYEHVQFLWPFDDETEKNIPKLCPSIAKLKDEETSTEIPCISKLNNEIDVAGQLYKVTGYIASVSQPKHLGKGEESANIVSIFANGRLFAEDVLNEFGSAKYYKNYLVGEIHADFLDRDDVDRATASREAIKKDDPKYRALILALQSHLEGIGDKWDEWRTALGIDIENESNSAITQWLSTLADKRDLTAAKRLMTSIQNATIHSDDEKNRAAKKVLYRGAIIGFEKLRLRKQLDRLAKISDVLSPEFAVIFGALGDVEEAAYAEITSQRLEVIKKFKEIVSDPEALEKVAQKYLFNNLWLLDPSWDRVSGRAEMEKTLTEYIKSADPDSTGARLDITYRASSGRHIIVELKRPKLTNLNFDALQSQARKYNIAIEEYYGKNYPSDPIPPIDIYLLISSAPKVFRDQDRVALAAQNARIITYSQLINDAYNAYQEYLDVNKLTGQISQIFEKL